MSKPNSTPLAQKLALLFLSIAIGICVLEFAVRKLNLAPQVIRDMGNIRFVDDTKMVYEYIPNSYVGDCLTNKQGFLDSDFVLTKPKNLIRIVMLGDSITQGAFAPCRKTFSDKLELLLNRKAKAIHSSLKYEVMNFGVGGYNLAAEVETLKKKALLYKPDIVIFNLFYNDNEPLPGIDLLFISNYCKLTRQQQIAVIRKYVYNRNSLLRKFERNILYKSKLYLFIIIYRLNARRMANVQLEKLKSIHGHTFNDMEPIYEGFREIEKLKEENGFKLLICIHPNLRGFDNINDFKFCAIAKSFKFNCFYMLSYYKKYGAIGSLQIKSRPNDDCHPNEFGHSLIAKAIFEELKKRGFIDPRL